MSGYMGMYNKYLELSQSLKNKDQGSDKLDELLTFGRKGNTNRRPAKFTSYLYCGSKADANDPDILNNLKITHVLNCAPRSPWKRHENFQRPSSGAVDSNPYYSVSTTKEANQLDRRSGRNPYNNLDCGVLGYLEIDTLDNETFPILRGSYDKAKQFIDTAKKNGGRVLVHCELGMNRSIAICLAYMVDGAGMKLMETVESILDDRPNILTNQGFRRQLVEFAMKRNLLD